MILNINTDALVIHANRLERLKRSALPNAVRDTLNSAAFDLKKDTLLEETKKDFINRSHNFFKANSQVEMAKGWEIERMIATAGMIDGRLKGENNYAVKDLEKQESGGTIEKKSFIPIQVARKGGSNNGLVKPNARLSAIKNIIDARKVTGKSPQQKFKVALAQANVGSKILADYKGKTILWMVNSLNKTPGGNAKLTPLYSFKENRTIKVKEHKFMEAAGIKSGNKLEKFFFKQMERQINKL